MEDTLLSASPISSFSYGMLPSIEWCDHYENGIGQMSSDSSEEEEEKHQNQGLNVVGPKQKTIGDQFREALDAASTNEEGHMYAGFSHRGFMIWRQLLYKIQANVVHHLIFSVGFFVIDLLGLEVDLL